MKYRNLTIAIFSTSLIFMLSACTDSFVKESEDQQQNMFEIEVLANRAYENNEWLESEKHYAILVENIPEEAIHWFRLGNIYAQTERPDAAVTAYRESLIRDPGFAKAWYNMGVLQLKQAVNSFGEFQLYVDKQDPLYEKSQRIFRDTLTILRGNNSKAE